MSDTLMDSVVNDLGRENFLSLMKDKLSSAETNLGNYKKWKDPKDWVVAISRFNEHRVTPEEFQPLTPLKSTDPIKSVLIAATNFRYGSWRADVLQDALKYFIINPSVTADKTFERFGSLSGLAETQFSHVISASVRRYMLEISDVNWTISEDSGYSEGTLSSSPEPTEKDWDEHEARNTRNIPTFC